MISVNDDFLGGLAFLLEREEIDTIRLCRDHLLENRVATGNGFAPVTLADFECEHGRVATDPIVCGCFK